MTCHSDHYIRMGNQKTMAWEMSERGLESAIKKIRPCCSGNPRITRSLLMPSYTNMAGLCNAQFWHVTWYLALLKCSDLEQHSSLQTMPKSRQKKKVEENTTVKSSNIFYCTLTIKLQHVFGGIFLQLFSYLLACLKNITGKWHYLRTFTAFCLPP